MDCEIEDAALPPTLSADWFLSESSRLTGLAHKPDAHADRAVAMLAQTIEAMPREGGRREAATGQLIDTLTARLHYLNDKDVYPGIAEEKIERPVIAMGFPRSGTSLLHELLAADPAARGVEWWETARPSSPPAGLAAEDDPRIALGDREQKEFLAAMPEGTLAAHPYWDMGGHTLMECERLSWLEFLSFSATAYWKIPRLGWSDLGEIDPAARFAAHRRFLQHLQYGQSQRRWALKGTAHHFNLRALRETYPDAIFIWIHRDPAVCFASGLELEALVSEGVLGKVDRKAMTGPMLQRNRSGLDLVMADKEALNDPGLHHLLYADFVSDPVGTLASIYAKFGLPCGDAVRRAWHGWLENPAHAPGRHGKFRYSFDDFAADAEEVRALFADYMDRFEIPV